METHEIEARVEGVQHGLVGAKRLGATLVKAPNKPTALSVPEICALVFLLTYDRRSVRRIAELGAYTEHTANLGHHVVSAVPPGSSCPVKPT